MNVNGLHKDNTKMMYHPNNNKAYPLIRTILDLCLVVGPISICHPCNEVDNEKLMGEPCMLNITYYDCNFWDFAIPFA
jgi:hypothetical protein